MLSDRRSVGHAQQRHAAGAVLSCVRVLAESVATLPLELRAREGRGTRTATEHPL